MAAHFSLAAAIAITIHYLKLRLFRYVDFSEYNLLILIYMTGIILTGGKSSRMGRNKAFLKINGDVIIERIVRLFKEIFDEVILGNQLS